MKTAIYLSDSEAELYKEFCKHHELYTLIASKVLDSPGGNVTLHIDENSVIRKVQTSRTFLIT